jgi:hypothetical protein
VRLTLSHKGRTAAGYRKLSSVRDPNALGRVEGCSLLFVLGDKQSLLYDTHPVPQDDLTWEIIPGRVPELQAMTIEINGMAHVILTVSRLDITRDFDRRLLSEFGMKPMFDGEMATNSFTA